MYDSYTYYIGRCHSHSHLSHSHIYIFSNRTDELHNCLLGCLVPLLQTNPHTCKYNINIYVYICMYISINICLWINKSDPTQMFMTSAFVRPIVKVGGLINELKLKCWCLKPSESHRIIMSNQTRWITWNMVR